jgi:hypothetical protein
VLFVRFQAAVPNERGTFPGIFALCNGLARSGSLSDEDWRWWRENNDAMTAAYIDPATIDPSIFDRAIHPQTSCWFKESAISLLERTAGYLDLLDRYGMGWVRLTSEDPGVVLYEDENQVVVTRR